MPPRSVPSGSNLVLDCCLRSRRVLPVSSSWRGRMVGAGEYGRALTSRAKRAAPYLAGLSERGHVHPIIQLVTLIIQTITVAAYDGGIVGSSTPSFPDRQLHPAAAEVVSYVAPRRAEFHPSVRYVAGRVGRHPGGATTWLRPHEPPPAHRLSDQDTEAIRPLRRPGTRRAAACLTGRLPACPVRYPNPACPRRGIGRSWPGCR